MSQMSQAEHRPDIQGLRGFAVLAVVLYHAEVIFRGGFLGVDIFFVISGFVITSSLLREVRMFGTISWKAFYGRRARRLLPALAMASTFTLVFSVVFGAQSASRSTAHVALASTFFNANSYLAVFGADGGYFGADSQSNPLLHLWSLSVEEQFYAVFPVLFLVAWKLGAGGGRRGTRLLLGATAASLAGHIYLAHIATGSWAQAWSFYFAPTRAWEFLAGALASFAVTRGFRLPNGLSAILNPTSSVLLLSATLLPIDKGLGKVVAPLVVVLCSVALLLCGTSDDGGSVASRCLRSRVITALGDVSYSWYLWHWPLIVFAHATWPTSSVARVVAAAASLLPAWLSARYVENRFRGRGDLGRPRMAALVGCSLFIPMVAGVSLRQIEPATADSDRPSDFRPHLDTQYGCNNPTPVGQRAAEKCVWNSDAPNGEMLLIGDSNAGQFSEAALHVAETLGLRLRIATLSSCPFVMVKIARLQEPLEKCDSFVAQSLAWIEKNAPRIVVMASSSDQYIGDSEFAVSTAGKPGSTDSATKSLYWSEGLSKTISRIQQSGTSVLLIHPVPKFPGGWTSAGWSRARYWLGLNGTDFKMYRDAALARQAHGAEPERRALALVQATAFDPFHLLCPDPVCTAKNEQEWWYRDSLHITASASLALADELESRVAAVLNR